MAAHISISDNHHMQFVLLFVSFLSDQKIKMFSYRLLRLIVCETADHHSLSILTFTSKGLWKPTEFFGEKNQSTQTPHILQ